MSEPAIVLENATRFYDGGLIRGVEDVSLAIAPGEIVCIMGPSGSGKSTLLNLIGTLDFATAGSVRVAGQAILPDMNLDELRASRLGFIFQLHNLIPNLTLRENVMLPMQTRRLSRAAMMEKADDLLRQVGLEHRLTAYPVKVSGGERQRTAIARALANDPSIILADEPTGNLDTESGNHVIAMLLRLAREQGRTIVMVSHNPDIAALAERRIRIVNGRIVEDTCPVGRARSRTELT